MKSSGYEGFPLSPYIYIYIHTYLYRRLARTHRQRERERTVSPGPTAGFKLKRGKLIQSSKFIGWKSSRRKRATSLAGGGQSCPVGLTLSYLPLDALPPPPRKLNFSPLIHPFPEFLSSSSSSLSPLMCLSTCLQILNCLNFDFHNSRSSKICENFFKYPRREGGKTEILMLCSKVYIFSKRRPRCSGKGAIRVNMY